MQIGSDVNNRTYTPYQNNNEAKNSTDFMELVKEKKNEIYEKLKKGETEPSFQIGAQSFTQKEWKKFLKGFDSTEETMREMMREEAAKRFKESLNKADTTESSDHDDY